MTPKLLSHNIKGTYYREPVWISSTSFFLAYQGCLFSKYIFFLLKLVNKNTFWDLANFSYIQVTMPHLTIIFPSKKHADFDFMETAGVLQASGDLFT